MPDFYYSFSYSRDVMALHLLLVDGVLGHHELLLTAEVSAALSHSASRRNANVDGEEYGDGRTPNASRRHRLLSPVLSPRPPPRPLN